MSPGWSAVADSITFRLEDTVVLERLRQIAARVDNMAPAMRAIGEIMAESTQQRFSSSTGPDGERWKPNELSTVLARLGSIAGAYSKKTGRLTKKGAGAITSKKPLVDTGILQDTIRYQLTPGGNGVEIGTNRFAGEWDGGAAVHQFGNRKGTIPARPFLGLSASDERAVLDVLDRFLRQAVG